MVKKVTKDNFKDTVYEFLPGYKLWVKNHGSEKGELMLFAMFIANYLLEEYKAEKKEVLEQSAQMLEYLLTNGNDEIKELASIGTIEGIQMAWSHDPVGPEGFYPYLANLTRAKEDWDGIVQGFKRIADTNAKGITSMYFLVTVAGTQRAIDDLLKEKAELFDHYMNHDDLSCCNFQGGFTITTRNGIWNGSGDNKKPWELDEFWMAKSWLDGIAEIWEGKKESNASYWEESYVVIKRISENEITIEDRHAAKDGEIVFPEEIVDLVTFTEHMIREASKAGELFDYLYKRASKEWDAADEHKRQRLAAIKSATGIGWDKSLVRLKTAFRKKISQA